MKRLLKPLCLSLLGLTLTWAQPSPAQSFEGLDVSQPKKKKKSSRKPPRGKKSTPSQAAEEADTDDAADTSDSSAAPAWAWI
jgi:hypothetical protein